LKLKQFSLSSNSRTHYYNDLIIPLLQRMINLEELTLYLLIIRIDSNYIDGIQLHDDILSYMPRLNKFIFNIETVIVKYKNDLVLSSNEDIQRSFIGRGFCGPVGLHYDIFSTENGSKGHAYSLPYKFYSRSQIFSLPYQFSDFLFLSNSFQNRTFERVQKIIMMDIRPFEHDFFQIISQSFPLLGRLTIFNNARQKVKQQSRTLITFPKLFYLDLRNCRKDYLEQFLVDQYCHLPSLLTLGTKYPSVVSVTNYFTNDSTRLICSKLKDLRINETFLRSKKFQLYFSSL
jgi:hypothetical protein